MHILLNAPKRTGKEKKDALKIFAKYKYI